MHFSRDCGVTDFCAPAPTVGTTRPNRHTVHLVHKLRARMTTMEGGNAVFAGAKNCPHVLNVHCDSRQLLHAVVRAVVTRASPCGPAVDCCFRYASAPCTYCQDGMYAVFAGAKNSHRKITIFRGTLMVSFL